MKKILFCLFLGLLTCQLHAQDKIYKRDKTELTVKVQSVNNYVVSYYLVGGDTNLYTITLFDVERINYGMGLSDRVRINGTLHRGINRLHLYNTQFKPDMFHFNVLGIFYPKISMAYEHINKTGKMGTKISAEIGDDEPSFYENSALEPWALALGTQLNFYPGGQGRVRFYFGPGIRIGIKNYRYQTEKIGGVLIEPTSNDEFGSGFAFGLTGNTGLLFQISRSLGIAPQFSYGIYTSPTQNKNESSKSQETSAYADFQLNLVFRF